MILHAKNCVCRSNGLACGQYKDKEEKTPKKNCFCSFYVIMSLHAKNCVCRSNGVACGQYKDKEEKTMKKVKIAPKNVKSENFENRKKAFV